MTGLSIEGMPERGIRDTEGQEEREGDGIREQEGARKLGNGYTIQQKW